MAFKTRQKRVGKFIKYRSPKKAFDKYLKTLGNKEKIAKEWSRTTAPLMQKMIEDSVRKGISPVKGFGRFKGYSEGYKDNMKYSEAVKKYNKKQRPVNLRLSGDMMRGFHWILRKTGFRFQFTDKQNDKAKWNSEEGVGAENLRRPILPKRGSSEIFKSSILNLMNRKMRKAIREIEKKARRKS
jgi:hypothetical protein